MAKAKGNGKQKMEKVRHALRKTIITKRVVDLFLTNMSENDQVAESQTPKEGSKDE